MQDLTRLSPPIGLVRLPAWLIPSATTSPGSAVLTEGQLLCLLILPMLSASQLGWVSDVLSPHGALPVGATCEMMFASLEVRGLEF